MQRSPRATPWSCQNRLTAGARSTPDHGEGVLEGDCQVAIIVEPANGKRPIAERYGDYSTSGLSFTVAPREENFFILDVKKSGN